VSPRATSAPVLPSPFHPPFFPPFFFFFFFFFFPSAPGQGRREFRQYFARRGGTGRRAWFRSLILLSFLLSPFFFSFFLFLPRSRIRRAGEFRAHDLSGPYLLFFFPFFSFFFFFRSQIKLTVRGQLWDCDTTPLSFSFSLFSFFLPSEKCAWAERRCTTEDPSR